MSRRRFRLPLLLQAPAEPIRTRPLRLDARTTPARFTLRVIFGARRFTVPSALLSVVHQLGEALVPVLMGLSIERAVSTGDLRQLLLWLTLLAADFAMLSFSWRYGSRIGELGMLAVQHRLRSTITEHLLRATPGAAPAVPPGVALSLATSDVNRLSYAVMIGIYPVGQFAAVLFGGAILLSLSWPLGLAMLLGAPLLLWVTDRAGGSLRRRSGAEQESAATAAGQAADLMAGYRVIRGIGAEAEASVRYRRASRTALASTLHARRAEGTFTGAMDLVTGLFLTAIAVAAALVALAGQLGLGELITVIGLTQFLIAPLQNVAKTAGTLWASGTASAERLLTLLRADAPAGAESPASLDPLESPPTGIRSAGLLEGIDAGEIVAVAADGVTAEALLAALRREQPGALIVPHAAHLFAGTVLDNVALPLVPAHRVRAALLAAGCDELAEVLPHGYDTPVGENGTALSGGQRQRVALARALAQDAPVLVLHDPTTAVDAVTEAAIAGRLRGIRGQLRTLLITRSPALLAIADRVHTPGDEARTLAEAIR
ncbi:ABC transporter transmembrane domain-containing protein [Cryobacterium arcticum]|uniref:ABC transporter ATP-binding protein n=1 Tax=Cryobacterium arcticum TaxID=670052 RepID=A0A317ZU10_9MICO|nr:ABC transporter ATP-binding protein [Cryobacterium arcticum]PXA68245.1 ABC transporter ATP-binding protein [Cryobacterium arcticum]